MKFMAVSTEDNAATALHLAISQGFITFIYEHADPLRRLCSNKFLYVHDDQELKEKMDLVKAEPIILDELSRAYMHGVI